MKKIGFLWVYVIGMATLFSQDREISYAKEDFEILISQGDSLMKDENRASALHMYKKALLLAQDEKENKKAAFANKKIGTFYYVEKDYKQAEKYYKDGLCFDSNTKTIAELYYNIYLVKRKLKQNDSVIHYLKISLKNYEQFNGDRSTFNAYFNGGLFFKNRQFFNQATYYLQLSYNGFRELKDTMSLAKVCTSLGNVNNRLKNYNVAIDYHREALELIGQNNWSNTLGVSHNNLGETFNKVQQYDSALVHLSNAKKILSPSQKAYGITLNNLASTYMAMGQMRLAEVNAKESLEAKKKLKDTSSILYSYNTVAEIYLENQKAQKAKPYLDTVANFISKTKDQVVALDYYKNQKSYHEIKGDYKTALVFNEKYLKIFERIYDLEQTQIVQSLQAQFETAQKENEILRLTLDNKSNLLLLGKKDEELKYRNFFIVLLGLGVLLSLVTYYVFVQKQKVENQNLKIEKLDAIHKGQDNLKRRIARDLHDVVANSYSGLRLKVLAISNMKNPKHLAQEVAEDLEQIDEQVRSLSYRLSPLATHIKGSSFTEILNARLSEFQLYQNVRVNLENRFLEEMNALEYEVQDALYAVCMETLTNVSKYAEATTLTICHSIDENNWLHFTFEDNGVGINENYEKGTGLMNIAQRMEVLGGKSSVKKTEIGTKVAISFPLE